MLNSGNIRILITWFVIMLFNFGTFAFAECFLCTEKQTTGLIHKKETNEWAQVKIKSRQFLLKPLKPNDKKGEHEYGVYDGENGSFLFPCQSWFAKWVQLIVEMKITISLNLCAEKLARVKLQLLIQGQPIYFPEEIRTPKYWSRYMMWQFLTAGLQIEPCNHYL